MSAAWGPERTSRPPAEALSGLPEGNGDEDGDNVDGDDDDEEEKDGGGCGDELGEGTAGADASRKISSSLGSLSAFALAVSLASWIRCWEEA